MSKKYARQIKVFPYSNSPDIWPDSKNTPIEDINKFIKEHSGLTLDAPTIHYEENLDSFVVFYTIEYEDED